MNRNDYDNHHPLVLGYIAWHEEAERRGKRGMQQRRCPDCRLWFWRDEWGSHGGWAKAERAPAREAVE